MTDNEISGSCLCGEVTYKYNSPIKIFQYCHCSRCRKFTGSAFSANIIIEPSQFEWLSGELSLGRFEPSEAKHFATTFCTKCGSSLPWLAKSGRAMVIPAGTLNGDPNEKPIHNIFMANKALWFEEVCELKQYNGLPIKKS